MDDSFVYYYQEFILESILPFVFQGHRKKWFTIFIFHQKMSEDYVSQCCDKASEFIFRGELDKATKYLKKAMDRDPSNTRALELLTIIAGKKRTEESNCTFRILY